MVATMHVIIDLGVKYSIGRKVGRTRVSCRRKVWAARGVEGNANREFCKLGRLGTDGEEPESACANGNWCILMLSWGLLGTRPVARPVAMGEHSPVDVGRR